MTKTSLIQQKNLLTICNNKSQAQAINSLPVNRTLQEFKKYGIWLFRGYNINYEQMKTFAEKFSSRFVLDKDRPIVDSHNKYVTLVDPGTHYVSPHCENANSPFRPDVIWFCCGVPASQGGETLFWDGVQVWKELREDLRELYHLPKIAGWILEMVKG